MKKDGERQYLEAFMELRQDLQLSVIRGCESPDFICRAGDLTVGIEMTRFFFPSTDRISPQAVNQYRDQLARNLRDEHARRGIPAVHVTVHLFSDQKLIDRDLRQRLAACLLDFVSLRIPPAGPPVEFDYDSLDPALRELCVNSILVFRNTALTKPFWSLSYAAFIPESRPPLIQNIVSEKSSLVVEYRKKAPIIWLLIISGTGGLHSIVDFDGDILTASYTTTFDRIFLFRTFGPSVHELKTA